MQKSIVLEKVSKILNLKVFLDRTFFEQVHKKSTIPTFSLTIICKSLNFYSTKNVSKEQQVFKNKFFRVTKFLKKPHAW
jgi:hypothetical protein